MKDFFYILYSTLRTKVISVWTKFKLWTTPSYIKSRLLVKLRTFFTRLLNIKPRDKKDYYTLFGWMISKKLAFAVIVLAGSLSLWYIYLMKPSAFQWNLFGGTDSMRTYKYNSIPLKFYSGQVRILGKSKYVAYVGGVEDGVVTGKGKLYDQKGNTVYEGDFVNNMYNGSGKEYYHGEILKYEGEFTDNRYNGTGTYYRDTGVPEYDGQFVNDYRHGAGKLYNAAGDLIYTGNFGYNNLLYGELVGKSTQEVSQMYTGDIKVYSGEEDYCVAMPEINALYYGISGEDALDNNWKVGGVFVLANIFHMGNQSFSSIKELNAYFGEPDYSGNSAASFSEVVAINTLADQGNSQFGRIAMETTEEFEGVNSVTSYDSDYTIYLYVYKKDGLVYSFYAKDKDSNFSMYLIEEN